MATKVTTRRFSYQTAQRAGAILEESNVEGRTMSMGRALRLAEQEQAGTRPVGREVERAAQ